MGGTQVKCECGNIATFQITIGPPSYDLSQIVSPIKNDMFGIGYIGQLTNYKTWSFNFERYEACMCDDHFKVVSKNLEKHNIKSKVRKSETGFQKVDLP